MAQAQKNIMTVTYHKWTLALPTTAVQVQKAIDWIRSEMKVSSMQWEDLVTVTADEETLTFTVEDKDIAPVVEHSEAAHD
jgi:hypothetical protein